jgi:CheY-like chemotaxis protein
MAKKVLVVDDEEHILTLIKGILEAEGISVCTAQNSIECLTYLENGMKPSLILIDIMMPGMDGIQLWETLQKNPKWHSIKTAFLTVMRKEEVANRLKEGKYESFIEKPFDNDKLVDEIKRILRLQHLCVVPPISSWH